MEMELREQMQRAELIGLSLSFCVRDIIVGPTKYEDVQFIIASTRIDNEKTLDRVIEQYKKNYWIDNPEEGERIARRFWNEHKILQPRLLNDEVYPIIAKNHWARII